MIDLLCSNLNMHSIKYWIKFESKKPYHAKLYIIYYEYIKIYKILYIMYLNYSIIKF